MKVYCLGCNTVVAPNDPEKQKVGKFYFHGACFAKYLRKTPLAKATEKEETTLQTFDMKGVIQ